MDPQPARVAGYAIQSVLGTGGTGTVYLACDSSRLVALKVCDARFPIPPVLVHPNIVAVYEHGQTPDGKCWLAMEYATGGDADNELRAGRMPPARTVHIVADIAEALDYAHDRGVVHGDVKPSNFLLAEDDRALLADFGVHPFAVEGAVLTSAAYAAPEILRGQVVDGRADVYSLGCSLFRLLTGKPPYFDAGPKDAVVEAHLNRAVPQVTPYAPWLPPAIDEVVATAMAKHPDARYCSAGELARAASAGLR
ncbi:serine/threonine-protein kinase [Mycolicibacterium sp. CBM1]